MNWIMRLIRFLVLLTFNIFFNLLIVLIRFLWPVAVWILGILWFLMFTSLSAAVHGPLQFIDRLAGELTQRLMELKVSREYLTQTYSLCRFLAGSILLLGWLVDTLFLVLILRVVFGFFT